MITHTELQIILEAKKQNVKDIVLEITYPDGIHAASFCGTCGRMICHPDCPRKNTR